jgi:hypothetical protein
MPLAGKPDEALDPVHVGLLGAVAVVPAVDRFSNLVEQAWRSGSARRMLFGHGVLSEWR